MTRVEVGLESVSMAVQNQARRNEAVEASLDEILARIHRPSANEPSFALDQLDEPLEAEEDQDPTL